MKNTNFIQRFAFIILAIFFSLGAAQAATFTVNTTADNDDGSCNAAHCTLREAIRAANATADHDVIAFNIPGAGVRTIAPTFPLPSISQPVTIDGSTQPGASCAAYPPTLLVEINGANAGNFVDGIQIFAGDTTVRGLVINRFNNDGININSGSNNRIECNFIGTDATGTTGLGNGRNGITVFSSNNTVGGATAGKGNLISGNQSNGVLFETNAASGTVQGNYIGTDVTGMLKLGNGSGIDFKSSNNMIGGKTAAARNVISGNSNPGIILFGTNNSIFGNYIGVQADGVSPLGNGSGVRILGTGHSIGDGTTGAGNTVAFSGFEGIRVSVGANHRILGNSIHSNGSLGINLAEDGVTPNDAGDADTGANNLQNYPVITAAYANSVNFTVDSDPANAAYPMRIEFFANTACDPTGFGEGETFLGSILIAAPGSYSFAYTPVEGKQIITSTATDANGNTSEFSRCAAPTNDSDGDGVTDDIDNCPDASNPDQADNDADKTGDACDPDDDNDGVPDQNDAFPFDANESLDTDGDGIGNNADSDDDGDGQSDTDETACGSNPLDAASKAPDNDSDNAPDCVDPDDDNDGVLDENDAFPFNAAETTDTDGDGIGNNADPDDDNDGQTDADETTCGSDPLSAASKSTDTDRDNIPDCVDPDDDNDGISDSTDNCRLTPNADQKDSNNNGVGDACETFKFSGFLQPVENLPAVNVVNAGQSVPVKFSLGGNQGLNIFAPGYPASSSIPCNATRPGGTITETTIPGGSKLTYDAATDRYQYVWKTEKSWKGTCRIFIVKFIDGTEYFAKFRFK